MSQTVIYELGRNPGCVAEFRNAWRGGMYVWNDIAKRYFGLEHIPFDLGPEATAIWNADSTHPLTMAEKIVLRSTMDRMVCRASFITPLTDAFIEYGNQHPYSSIGEQGQAIKELFDDQSEDRFIAWNQTSVSAFWGLTWRQMIYEFDQENVEDEEGYEEFYDPRVSSDHFELLTNP